MLILFIRYNKIIRTEFTEFLRSNAGLYFGVFLEVISITVIFKTDDIITMTVAGFLAIIAWIIIVVYLIQQFRKKA
jgi:hypothetical protein